MAQERLHVVTHEDGWAVKREGKNDAESVHPTQTEAVAAARDLAQKQEADVVIHRQDGTFRTVQSFENIEEMATRDSDGRNRDANGRGRPGASDVLSVGSRVSWSAILAGAAIALALIVTLGVLSSAIGLSAWENTSNRALFWGGLIASIVTLLVSLFVGGFVVSRLTAGEDKTEALMYGVVLWGVLFVTLAALTAVGANVGYSALAMRSEVSPTSADPAAAGALTERARQGQPPASREAMAWATFAGIVLSIGAAVGGAVAGAGPTLVLRQLRERRATIAAPRRQTRLQATS